PLPEAQAGGSLGQGAAHSHARGAPGTLALDQAVAQRAERGVRRDAARRLLRRLPRRRVPEPGADARRSAGVAARGGEARQGGWEGEESRRGGGGGGRGGRGGCVAAEARSRSADDEQAEDGRACSEARGPPPFALVRSPAARDHGEGETVTVVYELNLA